MAKATAKAKTSKAAVKKPVVDEDPEIEVEEVSGEPEVAYSHEDSKPSVEFNIGTIDVEMGGNDPFAEERREEPEVVNFSEYEEIDDNNPKQKVRSVVNNGEGDPLSTNASEHDDFLPAAQASIDPEDTLWGE